MFGLYLYVYSYDERLYWGDLIFDMQEEKLAELAYTQADAMMRRRGEL